MKTMKLIKYAIFGAPTVESITRPLTIIGDKLTTLMEENDEMVSKNESTIRDIAAANVTLSTQIISAETKLARLSELV